MVSMGPEHEPSWEDCRRLLDELPRMPVAARVEAFETLVRSSSPEIRSQALHLGGAVLSDERLVAYLADDEDAVLRNAGLEILKKRGGRSFSLIIELLDDANPEVVLQAVLILDHLKDPRALEPIRRQLTHADPNIAQAAIVAAGHLGDSRTVRDLIPFLTDSDLWLQTAAIEALGDLRSTAAVPHLAELLTDLIAGPLAAEALARIGGSESYFQLAHHWVRFSDDLDAEVSLGLLAHVLEGMNEAPATEVEGLRQSLARRLSEEALPVSQVAARCLLALGPGEQETEALRTLIASSADRDSLPPCLRHRGDLITQLLAEDGPSRAWGFLLAARQPYQAPHMVMSDALAGVEDPEELSAVCQALTQVDSEDLDDALLQLYARLAAENRSQLSEALKVRRGRLLSELPNRGELQRRARLVLFAVLGGSASSLAEQIGELPLEDRQSVIPQILDRQDILRQLPWGDWLEADPENYGPLAATVAARCGLRDLLPQLRQLLAGPVRPPVIRCVGEMGDRESIAPLHELLQREPESAPLVLESIGEIGGNDAREILRAQIASGSEDLQRIGYRALSHCATEDDETLFREAIEHRDWYVRLACAEVLGRSARVENMAALAQLVADPISIVSQRAQSFLDS